MHLLDGARCAWGVGGVHRVRARTEPEPGAALESHARGVRKKRAGEAARFTVRVVVFYTLYMGRPTVAVDSQEEHAFACRNAHIRMSEW